jgi:hypothetical protein
MLFEGSRDFLGAFMKYGFEPFDVVLKSAKENQLKRYLPIFEKVRFMNFFKN